MPAPDYAEEITALRAALATGELTIEAAGERVTYQSFTDVKNRLDYFVAEAAAGSSAPANRAVFGFSAVGFDRG